jgi:hypothetical protein
VVGAATGLIYFCVTDYYNSIRYKPKEASQADVDKMSDNLDKKIKETLGSSPVKNEILEQLASIEGDVELSIEQKYQKILELGYANEIKLIDFVGIQNKIHEILDVQKQQYENDVRFNVLTKRQKEEA